MGAGSDPEVRGERLVTESRVAALVLVMEELWAEVRASQGGRVGLAVEVSVRLDVPTLCKREECEFVASVLGSSVMVRPVRLEELRVNMVCSAGVFMLSDLAGRRGA